MRGVIVSAVILGLVLAAGAVVGQESETEEEAIAAIVQQYVDAWNRGDLDAIAALYSEDAKLIDMTGEVASGREAIRESIAKIREKYEGGTLTAEQTAVRFVKPEIAVVDGKWSLSGVAPPEQGEPLPTEGLFTLVQQKIDGKWLVVVEESKTPPASPSTEE